VAAWLRSPPDPAATSCLSPKASAGQAWPSHSIRSLHNLPIRPLRQMLHTTVERHATLPKHHCHCQCMDDMTMQNRQTAVSESRWAVCAVCQCGLSRGPSAATRAPAAQAASNLWADRRRVQGSTKQTVEDGWWALAHVRPQRPQAGKGRGCKLPCLARASPTNRPEVLPGPGLVCLQVGLGACLLVGSCKAANGCTARVSGPAGPPPQHLTPLLLPAACRLPCRAHWKLQGAGRCRRFSSPSQRFAETYSACTPFVFAGEAQGARHSLCFSSLLSSLGSPPFLHSLAWAGTSTRNNTRQRHRRPFPFSFPCLASPGLGFGLGLPFVCLFVTQAGVPPVALRCPPPSFSF